MKKSRLSYIVLLAGLTVLLHLYSQSFLMYALIVVIGVGVYMGLMIRRDAGNLQVKLHAATGAQEGKTLKLTLDVSAKHRLLASRSIMIALDITSTLFAETKRKYFWFYLTGKAEKIEIALPADRCGEHKISCAEVTLQDLMKLFRVRAESCPEMRVVVYPRGVNVQADLSRTTIGAPQDEGRMQNRKGNDPSEIFDIREYEPGDDIRAIHWKLSSKADIDDKWIVKESSDPTHYQAILLPDLGLYRGEEPVAPEEVNIALAFGTAIGEALLYRGIWFCMALPGENGLHLREIRDRRDFRKALAQWLSWPIQRESGKALQYFISEHLEQHFTRLVILSAGAYQQNVSVLNNRIGSTVVSVRADLEQLVSSVSGSCELIEIPVSKCEESYRIIC